MIVTAEKGGNISINKLAKIAAALGLDELPIAAGAKLVASPGGLNVAHVRLVAERIAADAAQLIEAAGRVQTTTSRDEMLATLEEFRSGGPLAEVVPMHSQLRDAPLAEDLPIATSSRRLRITLDEQNLLNELRDAFRNSPDAEYRTPFRGKKKYVVPRGIDVAAGHGAELLEPDEEVPREIPEHYHDLGARMVLRARGNSLIGRGIVDRDLLFVKPTPTPEDDRIIVCRLNDHAFVKIFRRIDEKRAELLSANPEFGPIPIGPSDSFHCFGVVVGRSGYALQQTEEVK